MHVVSIRSQLSDRQEDELTRAAVGAFSYFADRAVRKQMRIMRSLSAQKVRSCFRCNLKLSGLRDQRRINQPSENRLGIRVRERRQWKRDGARDK